MRGLLDFIGRACICAIFFLQAFDHIFHWHQSEEAVIAIFCRWHTNLVHMSWLQHFFAQLIDAASFLLGLTVALEVIGALLLFFGIKRRVGAFLLLIVALPTAVVYHPFWFFEGVQHSVHLLMFLKDLAIVGGLLHLCVCRPFRAEFS